MKQVLIIATFIVGLTSQLAQAVESIGLVAALKGNVYAVENGQRTRLDVKSKVYENQKLISVGESTAQLLFKDQSIFTLGHDTEIVLDTFIYNADNAEGESVINVTKGFFRFITGKIAKKRPEQVKVTTPFATIGVRGSGGIGQVLPTGQTTVGLTVCCLDVSNGQGTVPLDRPNFFTEITSPTAAPTEPKPFATAQLAAMNKALSTEAEDQSESEEQEAGDKKQEGDGENSEGDKAAPKEKKDAKEPASKEKAAKKKAAAKAAPKFAKLAPLSGDDATTSADQEAGEPRQPHLAPPKVETSQASQDNAENTQTNVAGFFRKGFAGGASYNQVSPVQGRFSKDGSIGLRVINPDGTAQDITIPADAQVGDVIQVGTKNYTISQRNRTADSFYYVELASGSERASMLVGQQLKQLPTQGSAYYTLKNDVLSSNNELTTAIVSFDGKKMVGGAFDATTGTYSVGFADVNANGIQGQIRNENGTQTFTSQLGKDTFGVNQLDAFQVNVNRAPGTQAEVNTAIKTAGNTRVNTSINNFKSDVHLQGFLGGFIEEGTAAAPADRKQVTGRIAVTLDKQTSRAFAKLHAYTETGENFAASFGGNAGSAALGTLAYATAQDGSVKHQNTDLIIARDQANGVVFLDREKANVANELGVASEKSIVALSGNLAVVSKSPDTGTATTFYLYEKTGNTWAAVGGGLNVAPAIADLTASNTGNFTQDTYGSYFIENSVFVENDRIFVAMPFISNETDKFVGAIVEYDASGNYVSTHTLPIDTNLNLGADFTIQNGKLFSYMKDGTGRVVIANLPAVTSGANDISVIATIQDVGINPNSLDFDGNENFVVVRADNGATLQTTIINAKTNAEIQRFTQTGAIENDFSLYGDSYAVQDENGKVALYKFNAATNKFTKQKEYAFSGVSAIELTAEGLYFTQSVGGTDKLYLARYNGDGTLGSVEQFSAFTANTGASADIQADQGQFTATNQQAVLSNFGLENVGCTNCKYVHWGLWNGNFDSEGSTDNTALADMVAYVAGTDMMNASQLEAMSGVQAPAGVALYTGALIGKLGNDFVSNGQLNMGVSFENRTVNVDSSTFGGYTLTSAALTDTANAIKWSSGSNTFSGDFNVSGGTGTMQGAFFGPNAAETGGNFQFTSGADNAAGIFIGKK